MSDRTEVRTLMDLLGHEFLDVALLRDALTHRSFKNERPELAPRDNERMEFLGDAILDVAASSVLWKAYPDAREGELSRRRADLVCERGLATIARELEVGPALRVGKGEDKGGGRDKPRLLASALEAIVAAVYLDAGAERAIEIGRHLLTPHVGELAPGERDYKSRLQERIQAEGRPPPIYELARSEGPDHQRTFHVEAKVEGERLGVGSGASKLRAEQEAARNALRVRFRE